MIGIIKDIETTVSKNSTENTWFKLHRDGDVYTVLCHPTVSEQVKTIKEGATVSVIGQSRKTTNVIDGFTIQDMFIIADEITVLDERKKH